MKSRIDDLAILGGPPAFSEPLHTGRPNIGNRQRLDERFQRILDSARLTNGGPFVQEFETLIRTRLGVKHCVATCNATRALEILAKATGLAGEVLLPSFTFVASAHALNWVGLSPVFVDIDADSYTIDPGLIERRITPNTSAILGVDLWGRPCHREALEGIATRHGLTLLFDASQAMGSFYHDQPIGGRGVAEVLSFHATKVLNSFEGGAIVTNDDRLAESACRMRNFGFTDYELVSSPGTNAKMSEVAAAMGITSLESLDDFIVANRDRYDLYRQELQDLPAVKVSVYDARDKYNYQYVVLELDEAAAGMRRDDLHGVLHAENVLARRYFYPGCHRMEPYRATPPAGGWDLPVTERIASRVLCLPTGPSLSHVDVRQICQIIRLAVTNGHAVRSRGVGQPPENAKPLWGAEIRST